MKDRGSYIIISIAFILGFTVLISSSIIDYSRSPFTPGFGVYPTLNSTELHKAYIIKLSLERALIDGEIIDGPYLNNSYPVVLSTVNIDTFWVAPIEGWEVIPLSIKEIQEEYEKEDGGLIGPYNNFVEFIKIDFLNDDYVHVEMGLKHMYFRDGEYKSETYWGLKLYLKRTSEGWIISSSRVMVI